MRQKRKRASVRYSIGNNPGWRPEWKRSKWKKCANWKNIFNNSYFSKKKTKRINSFLISLIHFRDNDQNIKYQFRETLNVMFTPKVFCTWRALVLWVRLRRQLNVLKKKIYVLDISGTEYFRRRSSRKRYRPRRIWRKNARGKYFFWETLINFRTTLLTIYCRST